MYYFHFKEIFPREGLIATKIDTNVSVLEGKFPREVIEKYITRVPLIERQGVSLKDQFDYRYAVMPDGRAAVFAAAFRFSFHLTCFAFVDPTLASDMSEQEPIGPFEW